MIITKKAGYDLLMINSMCIRVSPSFDAGCYYCVFQLSINMDVACGDILCDGNYTVQHSVSYIDIIEV